MGASARPSHGLWFEKSSPNRAILGFQEFAQSNRFLRVVLEGVVYFKREESERFGNPL